MKKRSMSYLVAIFTRLAVSAGMLFFITRVAFADHVSSKMDLDNGKGLSRSEVDWINGGGSLPQPNGGSSAGSHSGPDSGHHQAGSGNNEGNSSDYSGPPQPDGTPYPSYPNVVWNGNGRIRPADGYNWKTPNNPSASKYRVVPLPLGTPYPGYLNVVWSGDGHNVRPAVGYKWENQNNPSANKYRVIMLTTKDKIQEILPGALRASKDKGIRDWICNNVKCRFSDRDADKGMMSPWVEDNGLVFTERFLKETKATRENLIAFESGKYFFTIMKDKPVKDGKTLSSCFTDYVGVHGSTIWDMRAAKSKDQNEGLSMVSDTDIASKFGYVFRAQALQLDKPMEKKARQEWNKAIREFQTYIDPLLRGR